MFGRKPRFHGLASVTAGASKLDEYLPGWHNHVNTNGSAFNINDGTRCVLAQLAEFAVATYGKPVGMPNFLFSFYSEHFPFSITQELMYQHGWRALLGDNGFVGDNDVMRKAWAYEIHCRKMAEKAKPLRLAKVQVPEYDLVA